MKNTPKLKIIVALLLLLVAAGCGLRSTPRKFHDPTMDFSALRTVAVMPFANLTSDQQAAERVRDTFMSSLMATGVVYVIPPGEVARGISRAGITNAVNPSAKEIGKLAAIVNADAVITGTVREYAQVRSGTTTADTVSLSLQMIEAKSRKVVWTAASTQGGISMWDRLLGGGGRPMNEVTQAAVDDLINKLFY